MYILKGITTDEKSLPNIMDRNINASLNIMYLWKTEDSQRKEAMRNGTIFDPIQSRPRVFVKRK